MTVGRKRSVSSVKMKQNRLGYVSPLARAVLGGRVGDDVEVPGGNATIIEIR